MEKLSKDDEGRILTALETAIEQVNTGTPPNEAIQKVAEDQRFSPQIVKRMVEAYNVSKTLSHMKGASGSERSVNFPIADAAVVLGGMYPDKVSAPADTEKAAHVPGAYQRPETVNFMRPPKTTLPLPRLKVAEYGRDPEIVAQMVSAKRQGMRKAAEVALSDYRIAYSRMWDHVKEAAAYFKFVTREPFNQVEKRALSEYGALAKPIMDLIYKFALLKEERAEDIPKQAIFDVGRKPYGYIAAAIKEARELVTRAEESNAATDKLAGFEREHGYIPPVQERLLDGILAGSTPSPFEKGALVEPATALATAGASALLKQPGATTPTSGAVLGDVLDPGHEAKLQSIKVKAMLNDFMSNDPILSSYDQEEVRQAYNQLSELTPNVAQQPAVMRGKLRKMLQQGGVIEPFEADQAAKIERGLRSLKQMPEASV